MTDEKTVPDVESDDASYERSSIGFPYLDLETGIEVSRAVYNRGGLGGCDLDELAAEMKQTLSGAFRMKTATARTFGLIDKEGKSSVKLTSLGQQIVHAESEKGARVAAFMTVPLYAAVYEKYKGHLLPPAKALEREMQVLGVSSKQTDKARQAFERSARQAGFFDAGDDRLVRPRVDAVSQPQSGGSDTEGKQTQPNEEKKVTPATAAVHKPLEYQLIDLMSEPDIAEDVKTSIWSLVQYLMARKAKQGGP